MRVNTVLAVLALALMVGLTGCADWRCLPSCQRHTQNSTSLVDFLYPNGAAPPPQDMQPQLRLPLRVGLAFLPSRGMEGDNGLDAAHKEALLQEIRQRFISRKFVAEIVVIPDYYLQGKSGFAGLEGVQRLYSVDLMALVSYDQVAHEDDNNWSLGYVTIVGAYILKGTRHDVSTLVDLAVVDPATHSLVLRAGGFDNRHGNVTLIDEPRRLREAAADGFTAATRQMIDHFDAALTAFEAQVRDGKANVHVVSNQRGSGGGGGSFGWLSLFALLPLALMSARRRVRVDQRNLDDADV
ncbi:MAG TPA: rhombotarget lipoprotein [Steroidobacteraceae bacterium]|nr:rhombotarget lipoprotein [Steroidobacteraceae bacterium]